MFKSTASPPTEALTLYPPTEALTLYLSLGGKEGRDRKRTTVQGSWIMVLKTRCAPELREAYFMGVSLLPLCKVGTPSMKNQGKEEEHWTLVLSFRWEPPLRAYTQLRVDAFGKYTEELEEV